MGTSNQLKVLILENALNVTGSFTSILLVSKVFQDEVETIFVLPEGSACCAILRANGFSVYELPFIELSRRIGDLRWYIPRLINNARRLAQLIEEEQIKVVHTNDLYNLCAYTSRLFGVRLPILTHIRMMPASFPGFIYRFWTWLHLRLANQILCVSEAVAQRFIHSKKATIIFDHLHMEEKYSVRMYPNIIEKQPVTLLYVGNYMKGKGQDFAIKAFHLAYQQNPHLRLTFVGGDMGMKKHQEFKAKLMEDAKQYGIDKVVEFRGPCNDVEWELKQHHISLNFSISESFSMTCLEALYYGTPLIATDCGGPAELFEHGQSGYLVPVGAIHKMKEAILTLAGDARLRKQFSERGREYVIKKFIHHDTPGKLKDIYLQLAGK
jgi:glycosyltransferase involved in cell wall biosynthesis